MTNILDRIASTRTSTFRPSSPDEYFALRLAHRLGEPQAAPQYAILTSQYPQEKLLHAFSRVANSERKNEKIGRIFRDYLSANGSNGNGGVPRPRLAAIRVERRRIAAAVFGGTHLEGRRVLQLSSNPVRAESSVAAFVRSILRENNCESVAIEPAPTNTDVLRSLLHRTVVEQCRANNVSLWEVSKKTVFGAFAHPPLKSRRELREIILGIWPVLNLKRSQICALDAFALGLFVQTERLFNNF
jgi:hypothetical protein